MSRKGSIVEMQNSEVEGKPIENPDDFEESKKEDETISTEVGVPKKQKRRKRVRNIKKTSTLGKSTITRKKMNSEPSSSSPRIVASKTTFAQIAKELKAKRLAQIAHAIAMSKKRKKNRILRDEEIYTDKDRAAAVNVGTSDIKQSLKLKDKQNKTYDLQIPEESDSVTLLALGNNELRSGDIKTALNFINKALELNPDDKNGLIARSKCYLSIGKPQLALQDAETALHADKTLVRAIYQKAEALYHLGDFEHSLMYYHRGLRLRPELETFRLGIQKAQEAIEITIGTASKPKIVSREKRVSSERSSAKIKSNRNESKSPGGENDQNPNFDSFSSEKENKSKCPSNFTESAIKTSRKFRGDLGRIDRLYLENLLEHPDLTCPSQEDAANLIKVKAEEGISFLKSRQEFWKQRKPNTAAAEQIKLRQKL